MPTPSISRALALCKGKVGKRLALAVVVLVLEVLRRMRRSRPRNVTVIPGMISNLVRMCRATVRREQHEFLWESHKDYGRTWATKFPTVPWMVFTTNPTNVKHILKDNFDNYPKGPAVRSPLEQLLGDGIFIADGPSWHSQRKTASFMFTAKIFKEHIWVTVRRNVRKLREIVEATPSGKTLDVYNILNRFTLDTIGEIGFGKCIGSLEDPTSPFLRSFDKTQQISFWRMFTPCWQLLRFLGLGFEKETSSHFNRVAQYSRDVANELCSDLSKSTSKAGGVAWADRQANRSFVGMFLADAEARGEKLSEEFLKDLVLNFLIAGRDTTAHALSWTFYCLNLHPDVEARARQEIQEVCGAEGPSYEDLGSLPYLQAVINEVLRLYPSVPLDTKTADADDQWPDGSIIPKGTMVVYNIFSMGRDQKIWGPDAEEFRPDRWLEMKEQPSNYEYPVFNAGPRECLGKRLALVEMKACLATLLPHVSLKLAVEPSQICTDAQLTIGMGRGLPCHVEKITAKDIDHESAASSTAAPSDCASIGSEGGLAMECEG